MDFVIGDMHFCLCAVAGWLDIIMIVALCAMLMAGFPVAFSLAGTALMFAILGLTFGVFDLSFVRPFPQRIFGAVTNTTLIAVPMFVLMGVILEKSKIAEELLDEMAKLFGSLRGGLGISVTIVGALLAASTGIVGATVVTMGLLSLPTMLRRGYDPAFACGSIAAAGTLGQIIPPSIVLILLGDVISNAYQRAQLEQGNMSPETVSVGHLFAGALIPGLMLVGLYLLWQIFVAITQPHKAPAIPAAELGSRREVWKAAMKTLPPPLLLIIAVLGSILAGVATPTEAASVGAIGALLIAGARLRHKPAAMFTGRPAILAGAAAIFGLVVLTSTLDLRL
ncbi:TRAP dicarboxylate transporter, DctM subunit, unknown substrate 6, partial [hydrothermal vent metagenome]